MGFPINPPNTKLVDQNGLVTSEWFKFFLNIQKMLGQPGNPFDDSVLLANANASALNAGDSDSDGVVTMLLTSPVQEAPPPVYFPTFLEPGTLTAGLGSSGGGNMGGNITLTIGAGTGISVGADNVGLDTAHVRNVDHSAVSITAGAGLTGGGTIESTRTLDIGAGTGITVNANDVALANTAVTPGTYAPPLSVTVDAQGRITAIS